MKYFLKLFILIPILSFSQQTNISLLPGYSNQSFYSMLNGEVLNIENDNWDIAFSTDIYSTSIRINDGKGAELYIYPLGDTSAWNNINSSVTSILNQPLYNSSTTWEIGAFDMNTIGGFDYGWGVYNLQNHHVIGDSLYILKSVDGNWKKLWIQRKVSGDFLFKYADLDGNNLANESVAASSYNNKRFIYYSVNSQSVLDREPNMSEWDITFTKYITPVMGTPYGVTGVLSNAGIEIAETNVSDPSNYTNYSSHSFDTLMDVIGYDWKSYQSGGYIIDPNRCYFIKDYFNNVWRIVFNSFDGMSTGNISFNTELVSNTTSITDSEVFLNIYPNPANDYFSIITDGVNEGSLLQFTDISGRIVFEKFILNSSLFEHKFNSSSFTKGIYLVNLINNANLVSVNKLIIH